jgi:hypothetical protein
MLATGGRFPPQLREPEPMHAMVDAGPVTFSPNNCFQGFPFSLGPRLFPFTRQPRPAPAFHDDTITAPLGRVTGTGCQCTLDLLANLSVLVVHRMQS